MIISYYGKKFLKKYNEVEKKNLTPKEFFVNVFYPLFYGGEKSLMFVQNSPFSNPANKKKSNEEKLKLFFDKIENEVFDSSMFVGGYAEGLTSTTSFNVSTEYNHIIDEDEVFYSWFGHALSLKFKGIDFLFDNENILYDIHLGWKRYAELLFDPMYKEFKGSQISTWNTHWLNNLYSTMPAKRFNPLENKSKDNRLESISWVKLLFYVSIKYPESIINTYAYKFSQTNETYGTIPIETKKIDCLLKFCQEYFGENNSLDYSGYENILGTGYSMEKICELGSIGMIALKPELLKMEEYHNKSIEVQKKIKKLYGEAIENEFNYKLYNIYLMAKLNMKDIQTDVIKIAESLYDFQYDTRKNSKTLIDDILTTTNMSGFQKNMAEIMRVCSEQKLPQYVEVFTKFMNLAISDETKLADLIHFLSFHFHIIEMKKNK